MFIKKNTPLLLLKLISLSMVLMLSSCDEEAVSGCTDSEACNFNVSATEFDDSCTYAQQNRDCDNNCLVELDCAGNCGGSVTEDCNGECGGTATLDCNDVCGGMATLDCNDVCDGTATLDCAGACDGTAIVDDCGICGGDGPNENGCCEGDAGCTGDCDNSYIDCSGRCCQPTVYNDCLTMLSDDNQINFCSNNFTNDADLLSECELLNVVTLNSFCELQFGCASIDCLNQCSGGNTGLPNYDICDCFEADAANYWCNDGGQCPDSGSSVESPDALSCQDECIYGLPGSYIPVNPLNFSTGITVYNDLNSCCFTECSDSSAANYDGNCNVDTGCQTTNYIKIGQITDTTIELLINNSQEIGGFQFELSGATLSAGSGIGGLCADAGLTVSTGPNGVLGFSLDGSVIPTTDGQEVVFTTISYASSDGNTICLPNTLILSNNAGSGIDGYIIHHQSACE